MLKDVLCRVSCNVQEYNTCSHRHLPAGCYQNCEAIKKILTAVRECKKPRPKNDAGYNEVCETVAHNAAIDKVLAKLEGK